MKLHHVRHKHNEKARHLLRRTGHHVGTSDAKEHQDDIAQDKAMIASAIHKHERHDHPGKPLTKLKKGGHVGGMHTLRRLDKRARGGSVKKKGHTTVNVVVAGGHPTPRPVPVPVPVGARPPVPAAPGGLAGGAPMPPPGGMKRGGRAKFPVPMEAGSGGGKGRKEKEADYGAKAAKR